MKPYMKNIESHEEFLETVQNHIAVLAYFSTPTCNVCKVLLPKVKNLREEFPHTKFVYVNTEENAETAGQNLVFSVPTILIFHEGKKVAGFSRHFGMNDLVQILEIINN